MLILTGDFELDDLGRRDVIIKRIMYDVIKP